MYRLEHACVEYVCQSSSKFLVWLLAVIRVTGSGLLLSYKLVPFAGSSHSDRHMCNVRRGLNLEARLPQAPCVTSVVMCSVHSFFTKVVFSIQNVIKE